MILIIENFLEQIVITVTDELIQNQQANREVFQQISKQESCAIAKMTAQCAPFMGALKIFGTP